MYYYDYDCDHLQANVSQIQFKSRHAERHKHAPVCGEKRDVTVQAFKRLLSNLISEYLEIQPDLRSRKQVNEHLSFAKFFDIQCRFSAS